MESATATPHWLDQYGNTDYYRWLAIERDGRTTFHRALGLVEFTFDADGRYFEGRADMNAQLELEVKSTLSHHDLRERVLFAWTCVRCKHLLIQAKAVFASSLLRSGDVSEADIHFAVDAPHNIIQAVEDAARHLVFLGDHFEHIDKTDYWTHCQNSARILNPEEALAKLFVYPLEPLQNGRYTLRFLAVGGHQIFDGLATYTWTRSFVHLLNMTIPELRRRLEELIDPVSFQSRLPPPQEALYPPVGGSKARQRWFWLLTRILRHVRQPLPAAFSNPLHRRRPRTHAIPLSPTYTPILNYDRPPLLNCWPCYARTSPEATKRLHRLCREAKVSVGAGCSALAAVLMMEMYERQEPNIPLSHRRPFISGFPVNPRSFFNYKTEPESLMLAFCDGIVLPFLPSHLDLYGRLRLLARQAHRQLAVFQKRSNPERDETGLQYMGSRGAGRLLAILYVGSIERKSFKLPDHLKNEMNPQGAYPMRPNVTMQTCGVSSVGRAMAPVAPGTYNLDDESKDFIADDPKISQSVRPRDGEFLVGVGGSEEALWLNASVDGNVMDPALVEIWRHRFETILDEPDGAVGSKL